MRTRTRSVVLLVLLAFAARPARAVEIEVRIPAGDVTLAGTLHLPDGAAGPVPGAVIVHGSGKATREQNRVLVDRVRGSGLAVLSYDKRGVGASTGRYRDVNARSSLAAIPELADDAAAALRWLRARAEVDSTRTGFVGASQAGWIIPLAAVRGAGARFGVIFSGPAVSVGREIAYSALAGEDPGSKQGLTDEQIASEMARFDGPEGFDLGPVLRECGVPLLWIQGERDRSLPMAETLAALEALRAAGRPFEVHVVPGVNHGFRDPRTGERTIVWPIADAWLRRVGVLAARADQPKQ